jgi:hypothetical protein
VLVDKFPPLAAAIDVLGCATGATGPNAIHNCLGVGALGQKAVVAAIRAVAKISPGLREFLETSMPI